MSATDLYRKIWIERINFELMGFLIAMKDNLIKLMLFMSVTFSSFFSFSKEPDCMGEVMPRQNGLYCATNFSISPNSNSDMSKEINNALEYLSAFNGHLYLPSGVYLMEENIIIPNGVGLVGVNSKGKATIIRSLSSETPFIGRSDLDENHGRDILVSNLFLDNVTIGFFAEYEEIPDQPEQPDQPDYSQENIRLEYNTIFNTKSKGAQIRATRGTYRIIGNAFFRGEGYGGLGLTTWSNIDSVISGNYFGNIDNFVSSRYYIQEETYKNIERLIDLVESFDVDLQGNQGNFVSAWYATSWLANSIFEYNFISGVDSLRVWNRFGEDEDEEYLLRDHVIYIKHYDEVKINSNYFQGWPSNASGHIKVRNAKELIFTNNYLDNTSLHARAYLSSPYKYLENTYIFNNYFEGGMVGYWQDFMDTDEQFIYVENFIVSSNIFHGSGDSYYNINSTNKNKSDRFYVSNNMSFKEEMSINDKYIPLSTDDQRKMLPIDKDNKTYPPPLSWLDIGSIEGVTLNSGDQVYFDFYIDNVIIFTEVIVVNDYSKESFRWPKFLADAINGSNYSNVRVGVKNSEGSISSVASSFENSVWIANYLSDNASFSVYKKPKDLSYLQILRNKGSSFQEGPVINTNNYEVTVGDKVIMVIKYDGNLVSRLSVDIYDDNLLGYKWGAELAKKVNNLNYQGIISGERQTAGVIYPVGSSYRNRVWFSNLVDLSLVDVSISVSNKIANIEN